MSEILQEKKLIDYFFKNSKIKLSFVVIFIFGDILGIDKKN